MLQSIACDLGVRIDRTPKCHCELAGDGIAYAWTCSKNKYHKILLEKNVPKISIAKFCWKIKGGKKISLAASDHAYQEYILQENGHRNLLRGQADALWAIMCCTNNSQMIIAVEITAAAAAKMRQSCQSNWSKW